MADEQMAFPNMPGGGGGGRRGGGANAHIKQVTSGLDALLGKLGKIEETLKRIADLSGKVTDDLGNAGQMQNGGVGQGASRSMNNPPHIPTVQPHSRRRARPVHFGGLDEPGDVPPPTISGRTRRSQRRSEADVQEERDRRSAQGSMMVAVGSATFGGMGLWASNANQMDIFARNALQTMPGAYPSNAGQAKEDFLVGAARSMSGSYLNTQELVQVGQTLLSGGITASQIQNNTRNIMGGIANIRSANPFMSGEQAAQMSNSLNTASRVNTMKLFGLNTRDAAGNQLDPSQQLVSVFQRQRELSGDRSPMTPDEVQRSFQPGGAAFGQYKMLNYSDQEIDTARALVTAQYKADPSGRKGLEHKDVQAILDDTSLKSATDRATGAAVATGKTTDDVVASIQKTNELIGWGNARLAEIADRWPASVAAGLAGSTSAVANSMPGVGPAGPLTPVAGALGNGLQQAAMGGGLLALLRGSRGGPRGPGLRGLAGGALRFGMRATALAGLGTLAGEFAGSGADALGAPGFVGGALRGAGMGAGIGAMFGPMGAAIGAGIGGVGGGLASLLFAEGGLVPGSHNSDFVTIKAQPGEVVVPRYSVAKHGGPESLMQKLGFSGSGNAPGHHAAGGEVENGQLPDSMLSSIGGGHRLAHAAAAAWKRMRQETGRVISITDSYRTLAQQVDVYRRKPGLAARPGTSNHGLGMALDLAGGVENFGTEAYRWMKENAPKYGWIHPSWAEPGGSRPEPWHWEYTGGGSGPSSAQTGATGQSTNLGTAAPTMDPIMYASEVFGAGTSLLPDRPGVQDSSLGSSAGTGTAGAGGDKTAPKGKISLLQVYGLAKGAGFTDEQARIMAAIAVPESRLEPTAHNPNASTGDNSYGLWQINMLNSLGPARRKQFGIERNEQLFDPATNARAARMVFGEQGFTAWTTWDKGMHKPYLDDVDRALKKGGPYAEGSWRTQDEVARLHEGEMVLPAKIADAVRTAMRQGSGTGGGGGSRVVNIHVNLTGAGDREARQLAEMVKTYLDDDEYEMKLGAA